MTVAAPSAAATYLANNWQGGHVSLKQEYDYPIADIEGTIPPDLQGTLFRNGPGLLDINGTPLKHPFDGDGMICAIRFHRGQAHFRNRFVHTAGYLAEKAAGRILYRGVFGTPKPGGLFANAFDINFKNIANTHVIYWADKLLALWEADQPYRLDPVTLETLGLEDFSGLLNPGDPFSAHPRILPGVTVAEDRLVNFAVKPGLSSTVKVFEFDRTGTVVHQRQFAIPGFAFIHDFAITPNFYIFFQNPVTLNPLPFLVGLKGAGECISFNPQNPTKIWLLPRQGTGKPQKLATDACFVFHHANAFESDDRVIVDSICYDTFPALESGVNFREIDFDAVPPGKLWRFEIDPEAKTVAKHVLISRSCEFPTLNPVQVGHAYRYVYMGVTDAGGGNAPLQAILKLDTHTGTEQLWSAAPQGFMGEPVFIPKPNASQEDDGWLVALVYDGDRNRSDVVILDAAQVDQGPLACLHLQHHIPYGLHGSFTPTVWTS
ncbi:MAG: Apocarotenoid-15,15'-oxygenase [Acaryochloris sp. RU_4_1]|nr:Apocarotenoid-15,15'-oxygenase [Acaryochloris sp. RU_4_1]